MDGVPPSAARVVDPLGTGEPTPGWGMGEVAIGIFASLVLSTFIGALIIGIAGWSTDDIPIWGMALLQLPLWGGYVGAVVIAGRLRGNGVIEDFGVRQRWIDVPVGLVLGIATQLVVLPLMYVPILWALGSDSDELSRPARELSERADSTLGWILFALIVGVGAPVVEELFYRGLFLRSLRKAGLASTWCVVISAVVFAAIHFQPLQFPGLLVFGLLAGTLVARTGRLGPAVWAHIGFNSTAVVSLYITSHSDTVSSLILR